MTELSSFFERGARRKKLVDEYRALRSGDPKRTEYVPYPSRAGVVWRVSEDPLITGFDNPAINCCVMAAFGGNKAGLMHISPNTLPDGYTISTGERYPVFNKDVGEEYGKVLSRLGTDSDRVVIVSGDEGLARELEKLALGQDSVWGRVNGQGEVVLVRLGTFGKEVIAVPKSGKVYVAEHRLKKFADGSTVVEM